MSSADKIIAIADGERGYHEGPNNLTKYGKWYASGFENVRWCDMFVSWCADQAGLSKIVGRFAFTPSHANWFKGKNQWGSRPRRGAIAFFQLPGGPDRINHVGIVIRTLPDGGIVTIEGNVSDRVDRVVRRSHIVGYGYPAYPGVGRTPSEVPPFPLPKGWYYGPATAGPHAVTGQQGPKAYRDGLRAWQQRMHVRGWHIGTDGLYNDRTAKVCKQFQEQKGLLVDGKADGKIGQVTWSAAWTTPVTSE
ncbi:CHAP domain-containing protein [Micromonospora inositola]|uniref:Putative peptidoglycan binding domain-containing protein n=1 Tax=Micromonospora inositola TaxID=47865 RepID=A0A1C5JX24_9ACTN|nr:CHAP domain-containing protein [Micromonospora inositola]SCG74871.1 Putative peptidoglycan binding domain-containing protein [Micromonospora inositola]